MDGVVVVGRESVVVGDEEVAIVLALEPNPVLERTVIVAEMHPPGWSHARQDPLIGVDTQRGGPNRVAMGGSIAEPAATGRQHPAE